MYCLVSNTLNLYIWEFIYLNMIMWGLKFLVSFMKAIGIQEKQHKAQVVKPFHAKVNIVRSFRINEMFRNDVGWMFPVFIWKIEQQ